MNPTTIYPFIRLLGQNVTSPNRVYLNDYFIGNLSTDGDEQLFFDGNVVPLYADPANNNLTIELDQADPLFVSDVYISSGAVPQATIEVIGRGLEGGGVGGFVVPVDEFGLLAPYVGLSSTIAVAAVASTVYVKRVKRRKEKQ
jgi:hypothetical protein